MIIPIKYIDTICLLILLVFLLLINPAYALKEPEQYRSDECELIMKDYQQIYGGYFVFIQPLTNTGAFDFGDYNGHWLNRAYSRDGGIYYIDYQSQTYFKNTDEIKQWYYRMVLKDSIVYDFSIARPDFSLFWHY